VTRFIFLRIYFIFLISNFSSISYCQSLEIGGGFGLTTYDGEITPPTLLGRFRILEPAASIFVKYNYNRFLSARLSYLSTAASGDDAKSGSSWRELRNLSFQTDIHEVALIGEWNIFGFFPNRDGFPITPYLFGGFAYFNFDPKTNYNGEVVRLQPLGTEGQGMPQYPDRDFYSLHQIAIPFGGGLKWAITSRMTLSGEIGWRRTFTDYLDDISTTYVPYQDLLEFNGPLAANLSRRAWQTLGIAPESYVPRPYEVTRRGNPRTTDWYITGLVKVSYQIYIDEISGGNINCKF